MKLFNSIEEQNNKSSAVTDFLDSLDTDVSYSNSFNSSQTEDIEGSNDTDIPTENIMRTEQENNKEEITALVVQKPNSLFVAQTMFKKSIKISIKSFLISLSLGFLNLFF